MKNDKRNVYNHDDGCVRGTLPDDKEQRMGNGEGYPSCDGDGVGFHTETDRLDKKKEVLIMKDVRRIGDGNMPLHVVANFGRLKEGFSDVLGKHDYYIAKTLRSAGKHTTHSIYYIIQSDVFVIVLNETMEDKIRKLMDKYQCSLKAPISTTRKN